MALIMNFENPLTLADGRQLGWSVYGPDGGHPVLYCHGVPGSRREFDPLESVIEDSGLRLVVLERPGYGISSPPRGEDSFGDFARDAAEAMALIGYPRFHVIGYSGGGPYALACAARLGPEQVPRVLLVSSIAPFNGPHWLEGMNPQGHEIYRTSLEEPDRLDDLLAPLGADLPGLADQIISVAAPSDRERLTRATAGREAFITNVTAALGGGLQGARHDIRHHAAPWGFDLAGIKQPVTLFHDTEDCNIPIHHAEQLVRCLPHARLVHLEGFGHFGLYAAENLAVLLRALRGGSGSAVTDTSYHPFG